MLKKIMASLGVGSAKVDLVLDNDHCRIGEVITGKVTVEGGNVDQKIQNINFDLVMKLNIRGKEFTKVVDTITVSRDLTIKAKENLVLPFDYQLPYHYPISRGSVSYYLNTKMDIARAVDTGDTDKLVMLPSKDMALVMEAWDRLGFKEKIGSGKIGKYGQEFEYYPSPYFEKQLKELEIKFYREDNRLKMFLELDLPGGYMHHGAEHHTELELSPDLLAKGSVEVVAEYINTFLANEIKYVTVQGPNTVPSYQNYHYHQQHHGHGGFGFGGFMGGIATGLLGAAVLDGLFGEDGNDEVEIDAGDGEEDGGGLLDFDFGDFGDFGDDI